MIDYNEPSDDQSKNCVFCCPGSSIPTVGGGNDGGGTLEFGQKV